MTRVLFFILFINVFQGCNSEPLSHDCIDSELRIQLDSVGNISDTIYHVILFNQYKNDYELLMNNNVSNYCMSKFNYGWYNIFNKLDSQNIKVIEYNNISLDGSADFLNKMIDIEVRDSLYIHLTNRGYHFNVEMNKVEKLIFYLEKGEYLYIGKRFYEAYPLAVFFIICLVVVTSLYCVKRCRTKHKTRHK